MREEYLRVEKMSFQRLQHAEVCVFMDDVAKSLETFGAEALRITAEEIIEFRGMVNQLTDGLAQARTSEETEEIQRLMASQIKLLDYLRDSCSKLARMPYMDKHTAAAKLYPQLAPHENLHNILQITLLEMVSAIVFDLKKPENLALVEQLGFTPYVEELAAQNQRMRQLCTERTHARVTRPTIDTHGVRVRLCRCYINLITYIWACSIAQPSDSLTRFIRRINAFVTDTRHSFNRRMGQRNRKKGNASA